MARLQLNTVEDVVAQLRKFEGGGTGLYFLIEDIGDAGARLVAAALPQCKDLKVLSLDANNIGDEGARALAAALPQCKDLTTLSLHRNNIGNDGARALAAALPQCKDLTTLNLYGSNIGDEGARALAAALAQCKHLKELSLGGNIGDEGARALAAALQQCKDLTTLHLSANKIGDDGARVLAAALPVCRGIQGLYLHDNAITADILPHVVAVAPRLPVTLQYLNLGKLGLNVEQREALRLAMGHLLAASAQIKVDGDILEPVTFDDVFTPTIVVLGYGRAGKSALVQSLQEHAYYSRWLWEALGSAYTLTSTVVAELHDRVWISDRYWRVADVGGQDHFHQGWFLAMMASSSVFAIVVDPTLHDGRLMDDHVAYCLRMVASQPRSLARPPSAVLVFSHADSPKMDAALRGRCTAAYERNREDFSVDVDVQACIFANCTSVLHAGMTELVGRLGTISAELATASTPTRLRSANDLLKGLAILHDPKVSPQCLYERNVLEANLAKLRLVTPSSSLVSALIAAGHCWELVLSVGSGKTRTIVCTDLKRFNELVVVPLLHGGLSSAGTPIPRRWDDVGYSLVSADSLHPMTDLFPNLTGGLADVVAALKHLKLCFERPGKNGGPSTYYFPQVLPYTDDVKAHASICKDIWDQVPKDTARVYARRFSFVTRRDLFSPTFLPQLVCNILNTRWASLELTDAKLWREGVAVHSTSEFAAVVYMPGAAVDVSENREPKVAPPQLRFLYVIVKARDPTVAASVLRLLYDTVLAEHSGSSPAAPDINGKKTAVLFDAVFRDLNVGVADFMEVTRGDQTDYVAADDVLSAHEKGQGHLHAEAASLLPDLIVPDASSCKVSAQPITANRTMVKVRAYDESGRPVRERHRHFHLIAVLPTGGDRAWIMPASPPPFPPSDYEVEIDTLLDGWQLLVYTPSLEFVRGFVMAGGRPSPLSAIASVPQFDSLSLLPRPDGASLARFASERSQRAALLATDRARLWKDWETRVLLPHGDRFVLEDVQACLDGARLASAAYDLEFGEVPDEGVLPFTTREIVPGSFQRLDVPLLGKLSWHKMACVTLVRVTGDDAGKHEVHFAVRGSANRADFLVVNFRARPQAVEGEAGRMHAGFLDAARAAMAVLLETYGDDMRDLPLRLAGHSLGGATVTVMARLLRSERMWRGPIHVVTIGAPTVASTANAELFDPADVSRQHHFIHRNDAVPRAPSGARKVGHLYVLEPPGWPEVYPASVSTFPALPPLHTLSLRAHSRHLYLASLGDLRNLAAAATR